MYVLGRVSTLFQAITDCQLGSTQLFQWKHTPRTSPHWSWPQTAPQAAPRMGGRALGETLLCAGQECAGRLSGAGRGDKSSWSFVLGSAMGIQPPQRWPSPTIVALLRTYWPPTTITASGVGFGGGWLNTNDSVGPSSAHAVWYNLMARTDATRFSASMNPQFSWFPRLLLLLGEGVACCWSDASYPVAKCCSLLGWWWCSVIGHLSQWIFGAPEIPQ